MTLTPDYSRNFVKIPRPVIEALTSVPLALTVYVIIASRARWFAGSVLRGGHGVVGLAAGQAVVGRDELARLTNSSARSIRTTLHRLETLGILTTKTTSAGTIVTLTNYGAIGDDQPADRPTDRPTTDQQVTNDRPATDQRSTTNKKVEGKKLEKEQGEGGESPALFLEDDLRELQEKFSELYENHHGVAPTWLRTQKQKGRELLEQHRVEEILRRAEIMFDWSAERPSGRDFDTLYQFIDTFVADYDHGGPIGNGLLAMIRGGQ